MQITQVEFVVNEIAQYLTSVIDFTRTILIKHFVFPITPRIEWNFPEFYPLPYTAYFLPVNVRGWILQHIFSLEAQFVGFVR